MYTYVPTPVYVPPPSHRARELGLKLEQVIQEYKQTHPHMTSAEVDQALKMAAMHSGAGIRARAMILLVLGLTLAAVAGTLLFWMRA